jgi:hypothetical protein
MQSTEQTISVKHKKNGIEREFTPTQLDLMGKNNRKAFKQADPAEAGDANTLAEANEATRLADENASLKQQLADALAGKTEAATEPVTVRTEQQLQNEGLRVENAHLQADLTSATSSLETEAPVKTLAAGETEEDQADPNPELTALRAQYETVTGNKPGRLGIDKLKEAIAKVQNPGT